MKNNTEIICKKEYQWNMGFRHPIAHTDINPIVDELETIKEIRGKITPVFVIESAQNHKSPLHNYFEWNNEKAANEYRLDQARYLLRHIEIKIIRNGETKISRAYEVISANEKSNEYKAVNLLTKENMSFVIRMAVLDLERVKKKLSFYSSYERVVNHLTLAIEELQKEPEIISIEPVEEISKMNKELAVAN